MKRSRNAEFLKHPGSRNPATLGNSETLRIVYTAKTAFPLLGKPETPVFPRCWRPDDNEGPGTNPFDAGRVSVLLLVKVASRFILGRLTRCRIPPRKGKIRFLVMHFGSGSTSPHESDRTFTDVDSRKLLKLTTLPSIGETSVDESGRWKDGKEPGATGKGGDVLRVIVQANAAAAQSYYKGSTGSEYYAEGQEHAGEWGGLSAERLGLEGVIETTAFDALCENRNPFTDERITPRTKTQRRCGFDLNFHVPKSVSVIYGLTGENDILRAFKDAVRETLADLETETRTRVRVDGKDETRLTGNLAYSLFVHSTSRPVNGVPDPHLHAHAFVFNLTFDKIENRWKALELGDVYKHAPFYEALFHARLSRKLADLGFDISRTATGWEISGVPSKVLKAFSRRSEQIESAAKELGIANPELKSRLGAKTRERKQLGFSLAELRRIWNARLSKNDRAALDHVIGRTVPLAERNPDAGRTALAFAIGHCFERASVIPVKRLLAYALRHGVGHVTLDDVNRKLKSAGVIVRDYHGEQLATTKAVLAEETRILSFAKKGRNVCRPFLANDPKPSERLSPQQQAAVRHVLRSPDRVMLIRGVAGSGKTTLIKECVEAIQGEGKHVLLLAPSAEASRGVLRNEGFSNADTVARFLLDSRLQESVRHGVIWIDEAGLIGLKTLDAVFQLAGHLEARIVLSGDERQHKAVERGSPLFLLQREGGLELATVREIRRQKGRYKDAVSLLSDGKTVLGFDLLDRELGWVRELANEDRAKTMAKDYVQAVDEGKTVLAVSPTHAEGQKLIRSIRDELRNANKLFGDDREFTRLEARDLTLAERTDACFYREGDIIEFHSQAKGFRAGTRLTVTTVGRSSIAARDHDGQETILPLKLADRFQVYTPKTISLAVGDWIRITKNGKAENNKRLDNGTLSRVMEFTANGGLKLENGVILSSAFSHLAHGYVVTSHTSQGKTVDRVLIAQSSESFLASNREQFYVSASRGRESVTVYTDDKFALRLAIQRCDPNISATELMQERDSAIRAWQDLVSRRLQSLKQLVEKNEIVFHPIPGRTVEFLVRSR
jgi:conjugative relaxase-like TrwC/TraI family protein